MSPYCDLFSLFHQALENPKMRNLQFWDHLGCSYMIRAHISDQSHLCDPGKDTYTLLLSYLNVKLGRRTDTTSEEEEFSHLHTMFAPLPVENINVHACVYYVDRCISELLFTFSDQHQQQEFFF